MIKKTIDSLKLTPAQMKIIIFLLVSFIVYKYFDKPTIQNNNDLNYLNKIVYDLRVDVDSLMK